MSKIQVQFIVNQFAVNHVIEDADLDEMKKAFFDEWQDRRKKDDLWIVEDTAFKPSAVSMIRVFEYQEPQAEDGSE